MLTLLQTHVSRNNSGHWNNQYLCHCGKEFVANKYNVKNGHTRSCGCLQVKRAKEANTHPGMTYSREYKTWEQVLQRCTNISNPNYQVYGAKGITVCKEWENSFETFYKDMGPRPLKTSIDRIDNTKGYSKDNCRWTTASEQMKNRRPRSEWKNAK